MSDKKYLIGIDYSPAAPSSSTPRQASSWART